ncbi:Ig-like domain-containing protein [bacterium]|nr:Ig-like domain-containing protein [bacterium]
MSKKSMWYAFPLALLTLFFIQCSEEGDFNPSNPDVHVVVISELTATPSRLPVGQQKSIISGRVIDQNAEPFVGTQVSFSVQHGSIDPIDTTDANGRFSTEYSSPNEPGIDTVNVQILDYTSHLYLTITGAPTGISIGSDRSTGMADGMDTIRVTAALEGYIDAIVGVPIEFTCSTGSFEGPNTTCKNTNEYGQASVLLTAPASNVTQIAEVTASILTDTEEDTSETDTSETSGFSPLSNHSYKKVLEQPGTCQTNLSESLLLTFTGVVITVEAAPAMILGDGEATSVIKAFVKDVGRQAIPGVEVVFTAMLGGIPLSAITNNSGLAQVMLTSAERPGENDLIIARYGPELSDSVYVEYAAIVSDLTLESQKNIIIADGISSTLLTATVVGGTGNPAENIEVLFGCDRGELMSESGFTDYNGQVIVELVTSSSASDEVMTVWAVVAEDAPVSAPSTVLIIPDTETSNLVSSERSARSLTKQDLLLRSYKTQVENNLDSECTSLLLQRGSTKQDSLLHEELNNGFISDPIDRRATLLLKNEYNNNDDAISDTTRVYAKGVQLRVSTEDDSLIARRGSSTIVMAYVYETTSRNPVTDGTVYFSTPSGLGTIPHLGELDNNGYTEVLFTTQDETGTATILAQFGTSHIDSVDVTLLPVIGSLEASPGKHSLQAGAIDQTQIDVTVKDPLGFPSPDVVVSYETDFDPNHHSLRTDENGEAQFAIVSPSVEIDSVMIVKINAGELIENVSINLRAITRRLTATPDSISAGSTSPVEILFEAFEKTSRRPVTGDTVWFSGSGGNVQPSAVLDNSGRARTTFEPDNQTGTAWIYSVLGELTPDSANIELVEALALIDLNAGRGSILANGVDTTTVLASVTNILNDPTPEAWIYFEVENDAAEIDPAVIQADDEGLAEVILYSPALTDANQTAVIHATAISEQEALAFLNNDPTSVIIPPAEKQGPIRLARSTKKQVSMNSYSEVISIPSLYTATIARRDTAETSLNIVMKAVTLALRCDPSTVRANGNNKVGVNVQLSETESGRAIGNAEIRFGASMGSIPESGTTGYDGTAIDSLTTGVDPGECEVRAIYGNEIITTATVTFTPDPNQLNVIFTLDPIEAPADGESEVALLARVVNNAGAPIEDVDVIFTADGAITALVDADEYNNVTHWENTFRVNDPDEVESLKLSLLYRNVDSQNTRISINRNVIDNIDIPQDDLWSETVFELSTEFLNAGVNRISINGGDDDRFSVAGIRLGINGSHIIDESVSDENGRVEAQFITDETAGLLSLRAALTENPDAYGTRRLLMNPGAPSLVLISMERDTLIGNGVEDAELLAMVTDANGNPVGDGYRVDFSLDGEGEIEPAQVTTLADGTVLTRFTTPVVEDNDITSTLTAQCENAEAQWEILVREPVLRLTLPADRLLADGRSQMNVRARLGTNNGAPVIGRRIDFTTTRGAITAVDITDNEGYTDAVLTSGISPETATIRASYGPNVTVSADVEFVPVVNAINLSAEPRSILGSGQDSTIISVRALNGINEAAASIPISIEVDQGELSNDRIMTDNDGRASVVLFGFATAEDDTIVVIAAQVNGELADTLEVRVRGINITVQSDADSLSGNGVSTASVTARVTETESGVPVENGRVRFSSSLGSITGGAMLSEDGIAQATYTAPLDVGNAVIRASFGEGLYDETNVVIVDRASDMTLEIEPASILANGERTAQIVVSVTDRWGEPAPRERVELSFEGAGRVTPLMGMTNSDGLFSATATGNASSQDGLLIITGSARNDNIVAVDTLALRGLVMTLTASASLIPGDGESTSTITANIREVTSGHAVSDDTVWFSSTAGVIDAYQILDHTGRAVTELISERYPDIATVTATFGLGLSTEVEVAFASRFSYLDAVLDHQSILANGIDSTVITSTLRDTLGNPVNDIYVHYEITSGDGEISADSSRTDINGTARVLYYSAASVDDADTEIRVFAGLLEDTLSVETRGITLTINTADESLPANGYATTSVNATVRQTTNRNPVTNGTVFFSANAGMIGGSAQLNQNGAATVTLVAPEDPEDATITARYGETLTTETGIVFVNTVESLDLSVDKRQILADGLETVEVIARVLDEADDPAPDIAVTFTTDDGGSFDPEEAETDENGYAVTTYTGFVSRADSLVTIEANTEANAGDQIDVTLLGITANITSSRQSLPANEHSTATISLRAYETTSHNALTGHTVTFSADRGTIGRTATLDTSGIGRVTFTAPSEVGNARINAVIGDTLLTTFTLNCTESIPEYAEISVDPEIITVTNGDGGPTAEVTALITDVDHQPVPDGSEISLTFTRDIDISFADDEDTITVETENGFAKAVVNSGEQTGSVSFEVIYNGESIGIGGELRITAGSAHRIRVHADINTIYHSGEGLTSFPVNATVTDEFSNPVEDSTLVRFYINPDDLAQITAVGYTESGVISTPVNDFHSGIWLTFSDEDAGEHVWIHATANDRQAHDSTRVVLPGSVQGGEPASMELSSDDESLTADANSQTTIYARILDDEQQAVADLTEVTFSAVHGSVQSPRNTAAGEVASIYRAGRVAGIDTITVTAGDISDFITITLTPGLPATIELTAEDDQIRANGVQYTEINALLRDRYDNIVASGTEVSFATELGEIQETAETNENGAATARLTSGVQTGTTIVSARSGGAYAQTTVEFVSGDADGIVLYSIDREVIGVRGSGSPETATLIFEVRDDRGVPVDGDHRVEVEFVIDGPAQVIDPDQSSEDSVAYLEPASDYTDEYGRVVVSLNSGFFAGAVEVTANIGESISGQAISIAIHGGPPDQNHFSLIKNRCILTGIYGTPVDTTTLWVTVGDRFSNPTVPGTSVRFSSTGGVVRGSARTDSLGRCATLLTTTNPWPFDGLDTVTAQTVDWNDEEIIAQTIVLVTGPTIVSFDTTSGWRIPFGSYRNFVITVADTFGHPLTAGTSILIEAEARDGNGDIVEGLVLTGDATEEEIVLEECAQRSRFFIRIFNYINGTNGADITITATVTSRNGDVETSLSGRAIGQMLSTENSSVVLSPDEIIADGEDECNVRITLYDVLGVAIPDVPPDRISINAEGADPLVSPPEDATDANGRTSGVIVGREIGESTVQVRALGELIDQQPTLTYVPGPPARITVRVLDRQLVVGGDTTSVIVDVTDQSGNPTADGTSVIFETSFGSFTPASTVTRDGQAISIFRSGQIAGEASFNVTASQGGGVVEEEVTGLTFLAGPPANFSFSTETYLVQVRSVSQVEIAVEDEYGNPVAQNTQIDVAVDPEENGSVAPDAVQVNAEGKATVDFTAGSVADVAARIVATAGDESGTSSPFRFTPGVPGRISITLNPDVEEIEVGETIEILAAIEDSYGNSVVDTTRANFSTDPEDIGSLSPTAVNTSDGEARSRLSGVTLASDVEVIVQAGDISATTMITFTVGELTEISVMAEPNLVQFGRSSTLTATATDRFGNPIAGELLNFTLTTNPGGNCTLQNAQRRTAENGTATTVFTASDTEGSAIITVSWDEDENVEGSTYIDVEEGGGGG